MKTIIITEAQKHNLCLLLEDKATDTLKKYIRNTCADYLKPYLDTSINQLPQQLSDSLNSLDNTLFQQCSQNNTNLMMFLRIHFLKYFDIRHGKGPIKFIIGLARIGLGELGFYSNNNNQSDLALLKQLVLFADNNEQVKQSLNENLNGLSFQELKNLLNQKRKEFNQQMRAQLSNGQVMNGKYKVVPINSAEEAEQYGQYTSWCVTHGSYDSYAKNGSRFYFCLREGFENVSKQVGEGCPLDDYGLSMVSVLIDIDGEPTIVTTRWNHNNDGENNERLHTAKQVQEVLGIPFYQTFKPYTREELHAMGIVLFDEVQELLGSGKKPEEVFDYVDDFKNGFARVELNDKYNFINQEGKLLLNQWYNFVGNFSEGFAIVVLNDKWNLINQEGKLLSNQWYDAVGNFSEGFAAVELNDKYNFINQEGKYLSNQWFDVAENFSEGFAAVELNEKWNFINKEGKYLSNQWFDGADNFSEGFASVQLDYKWNFISKEGKLLSNQWFDGVYNFSEGFAIVVLNDKWNLINQEGKLLSNQWYDAVGNFSEGFAVVKLNNKCNLINQEGKYLSNQWFDWAGSFSEGFAKVQLNNKYNLINQEGKYLSNQWFDAISFGWRGSKLIRVYLNNKWYKINTKGEIVESKNRNKKTIVITEEQERQLKEGILMDALPEDIMNSIFKGKTSLRNNPALPSFFDDNFIEKISKKRFEEVKKDLQKIGTIDDVDDNKIETVLSKLIIKCQKLEQPFRNELEKLAFNYIVNFFNIPEDTVTMNLQLVDKVELDTSVINIEPSEEEIEYEDLRDIESLKDEIYKRRLLNVLSTGFGMQISANIKSYLNDIYDINPKLVDLYNKILALNNYLLFTREDMGITDKSTMQLGNVVVKLGQPEETVVIDAQGMIFPVLLAEAMRGFMELFASHGLPNDKNKMEAIIGKADYLKAEPWDMRLGPVLWEILSNNFEKVDSELLPYLYKRISMLSPKTFNKIMSEVFAKTRAGKTMIGKIVVKARKDMEYDKFSDKMQTLQTDKNLINDEYINEEEL